MLLKLTVFVIGFCLVKSPLLITSENDARMKKNRKKNLIKKLNNLKIDILSDINFKINSKYLFI